MRFIYVNGYNEKELMSPDTIFKCMSDETRLICLLLIWQEKELCVCELTQALAASQPKISRHLALLRDAGILSDRRAGKWVFYSLANDLPQWVLATIEIASQENPTYFYEHRKRLLNMRDRPDRINLCC